MRLADLAVRHLRLMFGQILTYPTDRSCYPAETDGNSTPYTLDTFSVTPDRT